MDAFSINLSLLALLASYIAIILSNQGLKQIKNKQLGLDLIPYLRLLLEFTPQHRGMVNAILQGDASFRSKIGSVQQHIEKNISLLIGQAKHTIPWEIQQRVDQIETYWKEIAKNYNHYSAADSFAQHTALISEILYLINDVAEESGILKCHTSQYELANAANTNLPLVTELLGQARGIGTGVAAKGEQSTADKIKLLYRLNKLKSVSDSISTTLKTTFSHKSSLNTYTNESLQSSHYATTEFLNILDSEMVNSDYININAEHFYKAGTDAIQKNFGLLDTINQTIKAEINTEFQSAQKRSILTRLLVMSLLTSYFVTLYLLT